MGAGSFEFRFDGKLTFSQVREEVMTKVKEDGSRYSDKGEYHGCSGVKEVYEDFTDVDKAYDFLLGKIEKWGPAFAVKVRVKQFQRGKLEEKLNSSKRYASYKELLEELTQNEVKAFAELKEKRLSLDFLKCDHCESKVNAKVMEGIEIQPSLQEYLKDKTMEFPRGRCPVCRKGGLSLPKRELKAVLSISESIMEVRKKMKEHREKAETEEGEDHEFWLVMGMGGD